MDDFHENDLIKTLVMKTKILKTGSRMGERRVFKMAAMARVVVLAVFIVAASAAKFKDHDKVFDAISRCIQGWSFGY